MLQKKEIAQDLPENEKVQKTFFRKGVNTSFKLVMNPHIKKSEIITTREDMNFCEELF